MLHKPEPSRLTGPEGSTLVPTWAAASAQRSSFLEHLRETAQPETYPHLSHTKPPANARFVLVVKDFTVDPRRRPGGEMIPCAACQTLKKFNTGALAYYPEEQVLRVIGNRCGDERRAEADAEYDARTRQRRVEEYLLERLPVLDSVLARALALRPAAEHAQQLSSHLRHKARTFCTAVLRETKAGDGVLSYLHLGQDAEGNDAAFRINVHRITGADFLRPMYEPASKLGLVLVRLQHCRRGDADEAIEWLIDNQADALELEKLKIALEDAHKGLERVAELIAVARVFLTADNVRGIDEWGRRSGLIDIRAQWLAGRIQFNGPRENSRSYVASLKPDLALLAKADGIGGV